MHLDVFSQGRSFFHGIDPRVKIVSFIPLVFMVALLDDLKAAIVYFLLSLVTIRMARIDTQALRSRLMALNVFIGMLWVTLPFSIPGKALFSAYGWTFSQQGALYTLTITLKANAILMYTVAIIGTSDVFTLAHALFHLRFPRKLVYLTVFLYRYISVLHQEYDRMVHTLKARCFQPRTNWLTLKTYGYMAGMLFVSSYERSQRIYQALTLRGFRGDFPQLRHFHLHVRDIAFASAMGGVILGGVFLG